MSDKGERIKIMFGDPKFYDPRELFGYEACEGFGTAPKYDGGGAVNAIENHELSKSYYIQASDATQKDYFDYIAKLENSGFERYYNAEAQKSLFSVYTDGYNIVNLAYVEYLDGTAKYINIAIDSVDNSALPPIENNDEKITDIKITMINSETSFVVRLENGSFIVIDGGVNDLHGRDNAELMFSLLTEQNVRGGKPHIAAWYISHHHGDHIGGFLYFSAKHGKDVDIDTIITNPPCKDRLFTMKDTGGTYEYNWINELFANAAARIPNAKFIMAHIGQRFVYSGLEVDVLYTPENYYGSDMFFGNHEVCVYSFNTRNGRVIFTGDAQPENCKMISAIYAEELKADFLVYAHHGWRSGHPVFYGLTEAKYGLWTRDIEGLKADGKYPKPDYNGIDPDSPIVSLVPTNTEPYIIFTADMTKKDLEKYFCESWE